MTRGAIYWIENKEVLSKKHKEWCSKNRDKRNASAKKYRSKNRLKIYASNEIWRRKNLQRLKISQSLYYFKNKERIGAVKHNYYKKIYSDPIRRKEIIGKTRMWALENPEKIRGYSRNYCHRNAHVFRAKNHKYRALKRGAKINITGISEYIKTCKSADSILCHYCGENVPKNKRHIDHKTPLSRGGSHSLDNLCCACQHCNCVKRNRTEQEFKQILKYTEKDEMLTHPIHCWIRKENKL